MSPEPNTSEGTPQLGSVEEVALRGMGWPRVFTTSIWLARWFSSGSGPGLEPPGFLVPEGLEDCVLEVSGRRIWIQIKSRKNGTFRDDEVRHILDAVDGKATKLKCGQAIRSAVILEQPRANEAEYDITRLFDDDDRKVVVCGAPAEEIVRLLSTNLETAAVIAEGLASDLYRLVADSSAENASLPFDERRRISTTEVERRIFERLEAEDPSAIDHALVSGRVGTHRFRHHRSTNRTSIAA